MKFKNIILIVLCIVLLSSFGLRTASAGEIVEPKNTVDQAPRVAILSAFSA